ncbi:MAG TPA: DUF2608 domain-containing protein [Luteimonas sp.]|nr:DUF2608 domain-containing protein [Luteimonas sp.]HRO26871.1 DUF2608 domain-containing protein [Luteimonas sp.]HRP72295.1 DUF2608 domain-containing protein [Luteimonas sp.]
MPQRALFAVSLLLFLGACAQTPQRAQAPPAARAGESQVTQIQRLADILPVLDANGGRRTLLVLDIDDTLLTSQVFFGSDRWYEWQKSLQPGDAGFVPCKFDIIGLSYEAGTQRLTEDAAARDLVNAIAGDKLLLTARNPGYRGGTIRELRAAGYTLPDTLGTDRDGVLFDWRPTPGAAPVPISYQDGVMMVTGRDKGETLLAMLQLQSLDYDRVVLVDDGRRNIDQMQAALARAGIDYHGLWYTHVDKTIAPADVSAGQAGWTALRTWLAGTFPERLRRMEAGQCFY